MLEYFPLQIVTPLSYLLIEGSPTIRRQFMDWGVFHLERSYPEEWKRFKRCLNQRNSALKVQKRSDKEVWDFEFAKYGTIVARRRQEYLIQLLPYMQNIGDQMLPSKIFEVDYFPGWDSQQELATILKKDFQRDSKFGFTHSGPHKSDLLLKINGRSCKSYLSRGQVKLLVLVMKLAQIKLLIDQRDIFGSLLIDDFCAELDSKNSNSLKQFLSDLDLQCVLTAMDRDSVGTLCGINSTLFHVEQGCVQVI